MPDAFENTKWDKEPCDHFKTADVAPRAEVAREIFEEIERFLKSQEAISENKRLKEVGDWIFHDYLPTQLAALKKKYTEEN
jgi:hypothetical protein